ncbi:ABC-type Fe3+-hydroxamate transport system, periplasmic component [Saccharomonospora cyanea NA-134]|uniref:ABC-type Fe3+-hydroxamate transport system, periplasmic component n=1 Tax=Saccharomonospora cyanea NA-134 TaxID=882082 RepID=H5XHG7_9PSEU|nr:ABC-type Fe3+-hydroxamate transport system, periplasmic component [Saccharomonospora cyanea NA-134]
MRRSPRRPAALAATSTIAVLGTACGTPAITGPDPAPGPGNHPVTITNCGVDVTFETPPERVVLLESAPVPTMRALGVLDSVVLRAGAFPPEYYDAGTNAAIQAVPSLGEDLDPSGHLRLSTEVIIEQQPDLVLGLPDGVSREALADVGIRALVHPTMCPSGVEATTFDDVYDQVTAYGRLFDRRSEAAELVTSLQERVSAVEEAVAGEPARTAAVLYPTVGGGPVYAYGNESMAHPQLETAGFTNVYADVDERVFEVTVEDLIGRNPDVLVLLHSDGDPGAVRDAVADLPGAGALKAVRDGAVLVQLFNFAEPPTPLSVDGLERIHATFGAGS